MRPVAIAIGLLAVTFGSPAFAQGVDRPPTLRELSRVADPDQLMFQDERAEAPLPNRGVVVQEFERAYRRAKAPRIAVFVNRELSAEVREWNPGIHAQSYLSVGAEHRADGKKSNGRLDAIAGSSVGFGLAADGSRYSPQERWMWWFEDGFMQPLLEANTKLVDRATILRLAAVDSSRDHAPYPAVPVKTIEVQALRDHADLFVELLVVPAHDAPHGYEFRAVAKEVATGRIVAAVTSDGSAVDQSSAQSEVVATASGFEIVEKQRPLRSIGEVADDLAGRLMLALARSWARS